MNGVPAANNAKAIKAYHWDTETIRQAAQLSRIWMKAKNNRKPSN